MIWPFKRHAAKPDGEPTKRRVKPYNEVVRELWAQAKVSPTIASLQLRTMPLDEEPIAIHCLLTMYLIREVERLKDENESASLSSMDDYERIAGLISDAA